MSPAGEIAAAYAAYLALEGRNRSESVPTAAPGEIKDLADQMPHNGMLTVLFSQEAGHGKEKNR